MEFCRSSFMLTVMAMIPDGDKKQQKQHQQKRLTLEIRSNTYSLSYHPSQETYDCLQKSKQASRTVINSCSRKLKMTMTTGSGNRIPTFYVPMLLLPIWMVHFHQCQLFSNAFVVRPVTTTTMMMMDVMPSSSRRSTEKSSLLSSSSPSSLKSSTTMTRSADDDVEQMDGEEDDEDVIDFSLLDEEDIDFLFEDFEGGNGDGNVDEGKGGGGGDRKLGEKGHFSQDTTPPKDLEKSLEPSEKLWRYVKKPLLRIGAKGATHSHGNSLRQLLEDHTAVKVKINTKKYNGSLEDAARTLKDLAIENGAPDDTEIIQFRDSEKTVLFGSPGTVRQCADGTFPPPSLDDDDDGGGSVES